MSLTGALLAVLTQQWAQSYLRATLTRQSPRDRARISAFHAEGLEAMHIHWVIRIVPTLIQLSLFLFFSGLPVFFFDVNRTVFNVVVAWLGICIVGYACITLMPIFSENSPYYSPLSPWIWWCVTNTLFIIYKLLKNFISRDSSVFRWYDNYYARPYLTWPSLRAMQKAAGRLALLMPSDIDYRALSWMFKTLNDDDEFEQFFDALPSLCDSEALADAQSAFIKPNEYTLSHALIGMMDRTLMSGLVHEEVKQRRIFICTKAIDATSLLAHRWTLRRVLCGDWQGFSRSIHFGLVVQGWKDTLDPVTSLYAQLVVAVTLASVQKRDDHWFQLASGQLNGSEYLLRNYFAYGDSILLANAIFIIQRTIQMFSRQEDLGCHGSDIIEASSKTLELVCRFDIQNTLSELQPLFCSLWNQLVGAAEQNTDPNFTPLCMVMLKSIRRLYITLHDKTISSPTAFSLITDDGDRVLNDASSYPKCRIDEHHHSIPVLELRSNGLSRNSRHVTSSSPMDMISPSSTSTRTRRSRDVPATITEVDPRQDAYILHAPSPFIPEVTHRRMVDSSSVSISESSSPASPAQIVPKPALSSQQEPSIIPAGAELPISTAVPATSTPHVDASRTPPGSFSNRLDLPSISQTMGMSEMPPVPPLLTPASTAGSATTMADPVPPVIMPDPQPLSSASQGAPAIPPDTGSSHSIGVSSAFPSPMTGRDISVPSHAVGRDYPAQTPLAVPSVIKFNGYGELVGLMYYSPHSVLYENELYSTALHLFEARKFLPHRPDLVDRIRQCDRIKDVTSISAELGNFIRPDWGNVVFNMVSKTSLCVWEEDVS